MSSLLHGSRTVSAPVEALARKLVEQDLTSSVLVGMALTNPRSGRTLPVDLLIVTRAGLFAGQDGQQERAIPSPGTVADALAQFVESERIVSQALHLYGFWIGRVGAGHQTEEEIPVLADAVAVRHFLEAATAAGSLLPPAATDLLAERLRALDRGQRSKRRSPVSYMRSGLRDLVEVPARIDAALQDQVRQPFIFRHKGPILPADVNKHLEKAMLARQHLIEGADYTKVVPNEYVVELNPDNLRRNFEPIANAVIEDWRERLLQILHTSNERWGRREYQFGGPVSIRLAPTPDLAAAEIRIRCRVNPEPARAKAPDTACLGLVDGSRVWLLDQDLVTIGRERGNNIHLDMPVVQQARLVSSQHAYITFRNGHYSLHDGSPDGKPSINGTFVNNRRVGQEEQRLHDGDMITLAALDAARPGTDTPGTVSFFFHSDCPLEPE